MIDVGCAEGIDPTWYGIRAPGAIRFFGFEANPVQFARLVADERTQYFPLAVSDTVGEIDFYAHATVGSVYRRHDRERYGEKFEMRRVPCSTLAQLRANGTIPALDVVKLDVEGHELAVLNGSEPYLSSETCAVKAEFSFHTPPGSDFTSIHTFLRDRGFLLVGLTYNRGALGELGGGDALYIRSVESVLAANADPDARRAHGIRLVLNALWLLQHDFARVCVARLSEERVISASEADDLERWIDAEVYLPDVLPLFSLRAAQFFFLLSQLMAGYRHGVKAAPKSNRLLRSERLVVSTKMPWIQRRLREHARKTVERYRLIRSRPT